MDKEFKGLYVEVNGDIDGALKKLKKMVKDSNLWLEYERARYYTKPSAKRRDDRNRAKARQRANTYGNR